MVRDAPQGTATAHCPFGDPERARWEPNATFLYRAAPVYGSIYVDLAAAKADIDALTVGVSRELAPSIRPALLHWVVARLRCDSASLTCATAHRAGG
ncbi:hypothetical protein GCM10023087_36180 [Microbacterium rhizosphaerae]